MLVWAIIVYDEVEYLQSTVERLQRHDKPIYVMCDVKSPEAVKNYLVDASVEHSEYAFDGDYSKMRNELDKRESGVGSRRYTCRGWSHKSKCM